MSRAVSRHRCRLGIGVRFVVAGEHYQVAQRIVRTNDPVGHLVVGGNRVVRVAVHGKGRQSCAIGKHGSLQAHHAANGAVVGHLGLAPHTAGIAAVVDGVLGVEVEQVFRVRGVGAPPEHHGAGAIAGGHRGQVGRGVLGELLHIPAAAIIAGGGHHDFRAVEQLFLLCGGERFAFLFIIFQILKEANPGGDGKAAVAGEGRGHVAVAIVFIVRIIVNDFAFGAHSARSDAAGKVAVAILIADVDGQAAVIVHRGLGAGVGVLLHHRGSVSKLRRPAVPPGCPVGVGLQVGAAEQRGRAPLQAAAGSAAPIGIDCTPIIKCMAITDAAGAKDRLVRDKQELGHKLDAHFAVDTQGLAIHLRIVLIL